MSEKLPTLIELLENRLRYAGPRDKTVSIKITINTARMILEAEKRKVETKAFNSR